MSDFAIWGVLIVIGVFLNYAFTVFNLFLVMQSVFAAPTGGNYPSRVKDQTTRVHVLKLYSHTQTRTSNRQHPRTSRAIPQRLLSNLSGNPEPSSYLS
jgi:hypothetical protein